MVRVGTALEMPELRWGVSELSRGGILLAELECRLVKSPISLGRRLVGMLICAALECPGFAELPRFAGAESDEDVTELTLLEESEFTPLCWFGLVEVTAPDEV